MELLQENKMSIYCFLQNSRVTQNLTAGILVSNTALVLQKVQKEMSGSLTCTASNIEGDTVSNPQILRVKCE